jgi:hypothetical protein
MDYIMSLTTARISHASSSIGIDSKLSHFVAQHLMTILYTLKHRFIFLVLKIDFRSNIAIEVTPLLELFFLLEKHHAIAYGELYLKLEHLLETLIGDGDSFGEHSIFGAAETPSSRVWEWPG